METVTIQDEAYTICVFEPLAKMRVNHLCVHANLTALEVQKLLSLCDEHPNLILRIRMKNSGQFYLDAHFLLVENGVKRFILSTSMNVIIYLKFQMDDTLTRLRKLHLLTDRT